MSRAFRLDLNGAQEVPANASTASGLGIAIYDDSGVNPMLTYRLVVRGLDWGPYDTVQPQQTSGTTLDNVNGAHFHQALSGVNGPIRFGLDTDDDFFESDLHLDGGVPVATI